MLNYLIICTLGKSMGMEKIETQISKIGATPMSEIRAQFHIN